MKRVYFVQKGRRGPIKIGISENVIKRSRALGSGMIILAVLDGGRKREMAFHRRFAHLAMGGEWFIAGPDLVAFVETLPGPWHALSSLPESKHGGFCFRCGPEQ